MIPYNWSSEEEICVNKILQLISALNIKLYVTPTTPNEKDTVTLKSAFSKMTSSVIERKIKELVISIGIKE